MDVEDMKRIWAAMTPAERASDLELSQVRIELMELGEELDREGFSEREIVGCFCEALEEKLARLYCQFYEVSELAEELQDPYGKREREI